MGQTFSSGARELLKPFGYETDADLLKPPTQSGPVYSEKWVELYTSGAFPLSLGALTMGHGAYHLWLRPNGSRLFPGVMIGCGLFHAALGALMEGGEGAGRSLHALLGERNVLSYDFGSRGVSDPALLGLGRQAVKSPSDRSSDVFQLGHVLSIASIFPAMAMNQLVFTGAETLEADASNSRGNYSPERAAESYRGRRVETPPTASTSASASAPRPWIPTSRAGWVEYLRSSEAVLGARRLWMYVAILHVAYHAIGFQVVNANSEAGISVLQMRSRLEKQKEIEEVVKQAMKERGDDSGARRMSLEDKVRAKP